MRIIAALALVAIAPVAAWAHVELVSSSPEDGATFSESPGEIRLVFSAAVEPDLSAIRLITEDGARLTLRPRVDDEDTALFTPLPGLGHGRYRVEWSAVSKDGHKVEGAFSFTVRDDTVIEPPATHTPPRETITSEPAGDRIAPIARGLGVAALLAFAGLLFFGRYAPVYGIARVGGVAAVALLAVHLYLWLRSISPTGAVDGNVVSSAVATTTGASELGRLGLTGLALALTAIRARSLALAAVTLAIIVGAASGHAAEYGPALSIPSKAIHLVAASIWLGGLLTLAIGMTSADMPRPIAQRVSSLALASVVAIVATGLIQALLIAGHPAALLGTRYGALLAAKAAGLIGLVAFGAWNRLWLLPRLDEDAGTTRLRASVRLETALLLLIVLVAGVLASTPPG